MSAFGDCTYCGGKVDETEIDYDYRLQGRLMVISNVPVGVCHQCGENISSRKSSSGWTRATMKFLSDTRSRIE